MDTTKDVLIKAIAELVTVSEETADNMTILSSDIPGKEAVNTGDMMNIWIPVGSLMTVILLFYVVKKKTVN